MMIGFAARIFVRLFRRMTLASARSSPFVSFHFIVMLLLLLLFSGGLCLMMVLFLLLLLRLLVEFHRSFVHWSGGFYLIRRLSMSDFRFGGRCFVCGGG